MHERLSFVKFSLCVTRSISCKLWENPGKKERIGIIILTLLLLLINNNNNGTRLIEIWIGRSNEEETRVIIKAYLISK